ncbi:GIN domain-containing protein [Thermonema rossianum]|uniref:GIN domain-containing protein n=1 Tax=Thermonema rossianum TaxID=55505 RepID=UPI0005707BF7|nr:DUF2807 domain-containing protein [Thermonema rossianum]
MNIISKQWYIMVLFLLSACQAPWECRQNNLRQEVRILPGSFKEVKVFDNVHLILTEGHEVRVEAPHDWLPHIYTKVGSDSVLRIGNENRCLKAKEYDAPIKVYVGVDGVKQITQEGYGDLLNEDTLHLNRHLDIYSLNVNAHVELILDAPRLYIYSNLGTDFCIKGRVETLTVFTQGFGRIDLRPAHINHFYTRHNGEGDILVAPLQSADIWIENSGDVFLYNMPPVFKSKITGSGHIVLP